MVDSLNENGEQSSLSPRWLLEHLNISRLLLLVKVDLSRDLYELGMSSSVDYVFWVVMDLTKHLPCFAGSVLEAKVAGSFCWTVSRVG